MSNIFQRSNLGTHSLSSHESQCFIQFPNLGHNYKYRNRQTSNIVINHSSPTVVMGCQQWLLYYTNNTLGYGRGIVQKVFLTFVSVMSIRHVVLSNHRISKVTSHHEYPLSQTQPVKGTLAPGRVRCECRDKSRTSQFLKNQAFALHDLFFENAFIKFYFTPNIQEVGQINLTGHHILKTNSSE